MSGRRIMAAGHALTWQQAHILTEFGDPADPFGHSSETLSTSGVREWPTCGNLIAAGLLVRGAWVGGEGWLYEVSTEGKRVMAALRETDWRQVNTRVREG